MRTKEKGRKKWGLVLAVVTTACLILTFSSSTYAVPHGVATGNAHTVGLRSDGTVVVQGALASGAGFPGCEVDSGHPAYLPSGG